MIFPKRKEPEPKKDSSMEAGATKKEPKGGDDELSMEEILQSIRRIIADDEGDGKKAAPAETKKDKGKAMDDEVPGSDMLELTDMLKDDGTVVNLKNEPAPATAKPVVEEPVSFDILNKIDEALVKDPAPEAPEPVAAPAAPVAAAPAPPAAPAAMSPADSLLSAEAARATADAFNRLKAAEPEATAPVISSAMPPFRSGATMEDMVADMLRPLLKQWLDTNLPAIVQQIVEREVRKLTK